MSVVRAVLALLLAAFAMPAAAQAADGGAGRFVTFDQPSRYVAPLHVTVWLPPGYDAGKRRYGVVYMHDGQNLFDPARSAYGKVWAADKAVMADVAAGAIAPWIVVGVDNPTVDRYRQYFPESIYRAASPAVRAAFDKAADGKPLLGDAYLKALVTELKPRIDRDFRTKADAAHTAIAGSSMGALISAYAFVEYPQVFGRAACLSTHWLLTMPTNLPADADVLALWERYIAAHLGRPAGRRLWMDHGTETLDANYAPWQRRIDAAVMRAGWKQGRDFESRTFPGAAHEENAWRTRLPQVFAWLLK